MDQLKLLTAKSIIPCQIDSDCGYLNHCSDEKNCIHDGLTFGYVEIICYITIAIVVGLANVGGLGGGIVKVPILVLILNFSIQEATFLTYPIIIGGVFSNIILLIGQRHPRKNRPIIDFNLALILVPTVLLGTVLGVLMNIVLSELILSVAFIIFLLFVCPYLFLKAKDISKKEAEDKEENETTIKTGQTKRRISKSNMALIRANSYMSEPDKQKIESFDKQYQQEQNIEYYEVASQNSQDEMSDGELNNSNDKSGAKLKIIENKENLQYLNEEKRMIPIGKFTFLILMFLTVTLLGVAKGGKGFESVFGIQKCDSLYYLLTALQLVSCLVFTIIIYFEQKFEFQNKVKIGYEFDKEEIRFSTWNFFLISLSGLIGGAVTGMLGMGSGLIVLPVLLYLGCNTRVCSATSGFMYLFIGGTSIIYVLTEGALSYQVILFYMGLALVGGLIFSNLLYACVNKYNMQSIIVWIIFLFALSNLTSTPYYLYVKSQQYGWQSLTQNKSFCD